MHHRRKGPREKDLTERYLSGGLDEDRVDAGQRFTARSKNAEQERILRTTALRAEQDAAAGDVEQLPVAMVLQVHSLYSVVEFEGKPLLAVVRKLLSRVSDTAVVVGDQVRFRHIAASSGSTADQAPPALDRIISANSQPEGVIEQILPRRTVLTRTESFKGVEQHPIVANADQMLIVVSLRQPAVKWGLVDRMIVAAQSGNLQPIVCLNKLDLAQVEKDADDLREATEVMQYYESVLGVRTIRTSVTQNLHLDALREMLANRTTVLAGHSGVGKSSLIRAIQPQIDLRVREVSGYTDKGRHTTTSARIYPLDFGGRVIDTPGVKLFGLWGVTRENLDDFFADIKDDSAPDWRKKSYERIVASLPEASH